MAPSELALEYLTPLTGAVIARNPRLDRHLCATAAEDAILSLIKRPDSYDPNRLALDAYLRMSASGDLKNALQAEFKHHRHRAPLELVDLRTVDRNSQQDLADPAMVIEQELEDAANTATFVQVLETVRASFSPMEIKVLDLMLAGERKTEVFAQVLGIAEMPLERVMEK